MRAGHLSARRVGETDFGKPRGELSERARRCNFIYDPCNFCTFFAAAFFVRENEASFFTFWKLRKGVSLVAPVILALIYGN